MLLIRTATADDVPLLKRLISELAEYEREPNAVVVTEQSMIKDGFGLQPKFRGLMAEWDGQAVGYALFYGFYSSWKGSGMYLEDLFVREPFRSRGIGKALLSEVARIAREEGCFALRWEVLGWNKSAIEFYKFLGGEFLDEWRSVLLRAEAVERLAQLAAR